MQGTGHLRISWSAAYGACVRDSEMLKTGERALSFCSCKYRSRGRSKEESRLRRRFDSNPRHLTPPHLFSTAVRCRVRSGGSPQDATARLPGRGGQEQRAPIASRWIFEALAFVRPIPVHEKQSKACRNVQRSGEAPLSHRETQGSEPRDRRTPRKAVFILTRVSEPVRGSYTFRGARVVVTQIRVWRPSSSTPASSAASCKNAPGIDSAVCGRPRLPTVPPSSPWFFRNRFPP